MVIVDKILANLENGSNELNSLKTSMLEHGSNTSEVKQLLNEISKLYVSLLGYDSGDVITDVDIINTYNSLARWTNGVLNTLLAC